MHLMRRSVSDGQASSFSARPDTPLIIPHFSKSAKMLAHGPFRTLSRFSSVRSSDMLEEQQRRISDNATGVYLD